MNWWKVAVLAHCAVLVVILAFEIASDFTTNPRFERSASTLWDRQMRRVAFLVIATSVLAYGLST